MTDDELFVLMTLPGAKRPDVNTPRDAKGFQLGNPTTANQMIASTQKGKDVKKDKVDVKLQDGKPKKDVKKPEPSGDVPLELDGGTVGAGGASADMTKLPTYELPSDYKKEEKTSPDMDSENIEKMQYDDILSRLADDEKRMREEEHRSLLQAIMGWNDIPAGQKWHHYLQHGLMAPGALSSDEVRKNAAAEGSGSAVSPTFGQELRYRASERKRQQGEWENLLKRWETGYYTGAEEDFFDEAERLMGAYAADGFPVAELRRPTKNAGGHAQGNYKVIQDNYERMQHMGNWMGQIQEAVANDPNWLNNPNSPATLLFDKLAEYTIIGWAQSKGAIADAEKIRAQVEAMPADQKKAYYNLVNNYMGSNAQNALVAMQNAKDYSAMADLKQLQRLLNPGSDAWKKDANGNWQLDEQKLANAIDKFENGREKYGMNAAWHAISAWRDEHPSNVPINPNAAVQANKNTMDMFQQWMMQNADVDRAAIWNEACMLFNNYNDAYNARIGQFGKYFGWNYGGRRPDPKFADYLAQVQKFTVPMDKTYTDTRFSSGTIPTPVKSKKTKEGGGKSVENPFESFI